MGRSFTFAERPTRLQALLLASLLAAFAFGAAAPDAGASGDSPVNRFRDRNYKYSVKMFEGWDQVPLETKSSGGFEDALSTYAASKFTQKGAQERGLRNSLIEFYRIAKDMTGEITPSDAVDPLAKFRREATPKSMAGLLAKAMGRYGFEVTLDPSAAKAIKSRDDVPGSYWVIDKTTKTKGRDNGESNYLVAASWKKDEVEIGMWAVCEGPLKKKLEGGFKAVADSFTWYDDKAEDVVSKPVLEGLRISAKKRREIEKGLVKGWDVIVSPKKNYIVLYNTKNTRNNALAKIIAERIEKIREQVYEVQFVPAAPVQAVCLVRVCGDSTEYHAYGGPGGSAGYWSDDTEELVFYDMSPKKDPDDDTLAVLYHEAFHQFIYYSVGNVAPHSWFNEGHGDYYAGSKYGGGQFKIHPFPWRVPIIKEAIRKGVIACEAVKGEDGEIERYQVDDGAGGYVPLSALVRMSQRDYYSYANVCYAEGWSLVYFLREIVPKNDKWNAKWGKILETYFKTLKAEVNRDRPLAPPVVKPENPAPPEEPGMDEPSMGDTPPPDATPPTPPGMDGGPTEPPPDGGGEPAIARFFSRFESSGRALRSAVDAAFKGIDFAELETAWKAAILKVGSK